MFRKVKRLKRKTRRYITIIALLFSLIGTIYTITDRIQKEAAKLEQIKTGTVNGTTIDSIKGMGDNVSNIISSIPISINTKESNTDATEPVVNLPTLTVEYLDVAEGDATLLSCDGHYMLIDGGENTGTYIQNILEKRNISTLDYVLITHYDSDHCSGLIPIIYKFDCDTIIAPDYEHDTKTYEKLMKVVKDRGYTLTYAKLNDEYCLADTTFKVIAPDTRYQDSNDNSVAIRLSHGANHFLFLGDTTAEIGEKNILHEQIDISADVIKIAHHGSRYSTSDTFLDAVNPKYAVISCGPNEYGHPSNDVLTKLRSREINTYRTDAQGTITCISNGIDIIFDKPETDDWAPGE